MVVEGPGDGPRPRRRPARGGTSLATEVVAQAGRRARRAVAGGPSTCRLSTAARAPRTRAGRSSSSAVERGRSGRSVRTFGGLDVRRLQRPAPRRLPRRGSPAPGGFNVEPREAARSTSPRELTPPRREAVAELPPGPVNRRAVIRPNPRVSGGCRAPVRPRWHRRRSAASSCSPAHGGSRSVGGRGSPRRRYRADRRVPPP